jgi:hypothetical protein
MLMLAVKLLKQNPEVREKYFARFQHILVDEFQDTNQAQYQLSLYVFVVDNSKISIRKDSPILVKLSDGDTLKLKVLSDSEDLFGSTAFFGSFTYTTYSVLGSAAINDDVINKIKKGISKIRIELNQEPVDIVLKEDNISDFIYKNYQLLKKQSKISNSFEKGF